MEFLKLFKFFFLTNKKVTTIMVESHCFIACFNVRELSWISHKAYFEVASKKRKLEP